MSRVGTTRHIHVSDDPKRGLRPRERGSAPSGTRRYLCCSCPRHSCRFRSRNAYSTCICGPPVADDGRPARIRRTGSGQLHATRGRLLPALARRCTNPPKWKSTDPLSEAAAFQRIAKTGINSGASLCGRFLSHHDDLVVEVIRRPTNGFRVSFESLDKPVYHLLSPGPYEKGRHVAFCLGRFDLRRFACLFLLGLRLVDSRVQVAIVITERLSGIDFLPLHASFGSTFFFATESARAATPECRIRVCCRYASCHPERAPTWRPCQGPGCVARPFALRLRWLRVYRV